MPSSAGPEEVSEKFSSYPSKVRSKLRKLRKLIFDVSKNNEIIGELKETLKWGEPSYLTSKTKSGSTVRIDWKQKDPGYYCIYFKCTTDLVELFRKKFPGKTFEFSGNRAIKFKIEDKIPEKELKQCIALSLTYHKNKKLPENQRWKMVRDML